MLVERLDDFLGFPKREPHGDPIQDKDGVFEPSLNIHLNEMLTGKKGIIIGVSEYAPSFLRHLERLGLTIGVSLEVIEITDYDGSVELLVEGKRVNVSREVAQHILIKL